MSERPFTILVTGPLPASGPYLGKSPENVSIEIIPYIRTAPVPAALFSERLESISRQPINAVFTSAEAVRILQESGVVPDSWLCWCTAGTTETLLQEWLGSAAVVNSAPDASGVADLLISGRVKKAVFFCGNQRRDVLPGKLKTAGIELEEIVVYETFATPVRLDKNYDAVLFFSPSAVVSFLSANALGDQTTVFALGKTTAEALNQRVSGTAIVSAQPDKNLLVQMAVEYAFANPIL